MADDKERKQNIEDDIYDMLESYGYIDHTDDEMRENGVSWSDFI